MANILDENVVILRFDNSDFEKNTKQSMDTLDKLKSSVDKTSGESLKNLGKEANSVNLSGLGKAIDTINSRFSSMGIVGAAVLNRLTNSAMTSAKNLITAIPKQAIQGGWQRALNIEQAQFLIDGIGKEMGIVWKSTKKDVLDVYTVVDRAVTGTRYALDEAAGVASQLLSSGVQDMGKLEVALKAISGIGSVTNSEYSDIGRIFAQVAGQGRMMGDDLLQLQQRNIDATAAIRDYLNLNREVANAALDNAIAQGRQAKKMKEIREQSELTQGDIREMVSAGAIDIDILSNSFFKFFAQAEKANETYTGSLANLKSAINRIGQSFMEIKLQNYTKLFNALIPVFKRIKDFTDPLAKSFGALSNKFTGFVINGLINPIGKAIGYEKFLTNVGKAAKDAADKVTKGNEDAANSSKKSRAEILKTNKEYQAARDIWYKGIYGNGERRKTTLEKIGISYKKTQDIINQFYRDGFKWDNIEKQLIKDYENTNKKIEETGDSVEKAKPKYSGFVAFVKAIINVFKSLKNLLTGFVNIFKAAGNAIVKFLTPFVVSGNNKMLTFSETILKLTERFANFTAKLSDRSAISKWLSQHSLIQKSLTVLSKAFEFVKEMALKFFETIKGLFDRIKETEGFNKLKEGIEKLTPALKELTDKALDKAIDGLTKLSKIGASSNMSSVVAFFSGLSDKFKNFVNNLKEGVNPFSSFIGVFEKFKTSISTTVFDGLFGENSYKKLFSPNGLFGSISKASESLEKSNAPKNLSQVSGSMANFLDTFQNKGGNINVKGGFKAAIEEITGADWEKLSKIALNIGGIIAMFKAVKQTGNIVNALTAALSSIVGSITGFVNSISSVITSASGVFTSISGFFNSLSGVAHAAEKSIKIKSFQAIAISIGILAGSIIALALIPTDRLIPALIGVLSALGVMVGIAALINSDKFDAGKMKDVGIAFAGIGVSLLSLGIACKLISKISGEGLFKAGLAILAFMGTIIIASKLAGNANGSAKSFVGMATAVSILSGALMLLAVMPWALITKGIIVIGIVMTELALASKVANGTSSKGLFAMANAVVVLLPAITAFALMPFERAMKGATMVSLIIAMLGLASRTAGENAGNIGSLVGLSVMVATLTGSLVLLSAINGERLATATGAIASSILSISIAAEIADKAKKGAMVISLVLGSLAASLALLSALGIDKVLPLATSLSVLALSLGAAMAIFSKINTVGAFEGIKALAITLGGIALIVEAAGAISKIPGSKELVSSGGKYLKSIGEAIGGFFGSIASSFGVVATEGLPQMADNISSFMDKISPFIESAKNIKPKTTEGVKNLAEAIAALTKAEFMDQLSMFTGKNSMEDFASEITTFAQSFLDFSGIVGQIPKNTIKKVDTITETMNALIKGISKIPKSNGVVQWITGWVDMDKMVDAILDMAKALGKNGKFTKGLAEIKIPDDLLGDNGKISKIAEVIKTMAKAIKKIPKSNGLVQGFTGIHDTGAMAIAIAEFSVTLSGMNFIDIPDDLTNDQGTGKINKICKVIAAMSEAAKMIPESGGIKQGVLGNTTIKEFAKQLSDAIPSLVAFFIAVGNNDIVFNKDSKKKVLLVAESAASMAEAAQKIPESGGLKQGIFGGQKLGSFAKQLSKFVPGFKEFVTQLEGVDFNEDVLSKIPSISKAVVGMAEIAKALPKSGGKWQLLVGEKSLGKFGNQLKTLLESLNGVKVDGFDSSGVTAAANAINKIVPAIQEFKAQTPIPTGSNLVKLADNISTFVTKIGGLDTSGLESKTSAINASVKELNKNKNVKVNTKVDSKESESSAKSAGASIVSAFTKAISGKNDSAKSAGKALGKKAASGAEESKGSMESGGKNVGAGFVKGINAKKQAAYDAGYALGKAAKKGQKDATGESSPAKEFIKGGKYAGEGLIIGLLSYRRKVYRAGEKLGAQSVLGENQGITDTLNSLTDPVITPVIDLSEVDRGLATLNNDFSRNRTFGINSAFQSNDYKTNQMMNDMVNALNKMGSNQTQSSNYFTFNVDGAENPEDFAKRFVRQVQLEMRTG